MEFISEMALPFEAMTTEQLAAARMDRFKARESWDKEGVQQRMHLQMAAQLQASKEMMEDTLLKIKPATVVMEGKDAHLAAMRQEINKVEEAYMQIQVYAVYGSKATEELYGKPKMSGKLSEDMEKKLEKFLKEGKESKKPKLEQASKQTTQQQMVPNWGWNMPGMGYFPMAGAMNVPGYGFGGYPHQMQQTVGAAPRQTGGAVPPKKRYPCDNCGSTEHWKSNPACPNFHLFLQIQAAKAEEMRKGQGTAAAATPAIGGPQPAAGDGSGRTICYRLYRGTQQKGTRGILYVGQCKVGRTDRLVICRIYQWRGSAKGLGGSRSAGDGGGVCG